MAGVLARKFGSLSALIEADKETLLKVRDIGPETSESIADFFAEKHNINVIEKLKNSGVEFPIKGNADKRHIFRQDFSLHGENSPLLRGRRQRGLSRPKAA